MTTLIVVSGSDGIVGRCDAKCYDASHDKCDCICGGMNHGVGMVGATRQTAEYFAGLSEKSWWCDQNEVIFHAPYFHIGLV